MPIKPKLTLPPAKTAQGRAAQQLMTELAKPKTPVIIRKPAPAPKGRRG